ncbi:MULTISPECIES: lasso peptide biosynthesis PqqD family chaperone [Protofrankia]|uniref:Lasso peptide biosynthesis PqqD family chaperone n=2 Tax=Protofrankia TaxID=2994361 RepID=F8B1B0_9ACTN|nr:MULTISPECIES: lasso peptide biosynthesis PqqD family chaperone [Protofrankia]AEH09779.1 hypothetical protein FsymDg_2395 [Candidatus Protofrankia datiscae]KLL10121.1 hypothetical protein FrCorBMG51_20080 [Protofrankia coriariae]ONH35232.1 hypothetical protein BL254_12420 [Protofrankia sp. BMG5.30]
MTRLRQAVAHTETDYGAALLDERSGRYWSLNPTGALVLRVLLGGGSPADAAAAVTDTCDVDATTADRDVRALLTELRAAGLLATGAADR